MHCQERRITWGSCQTSSTDRAGVSLDEVMDGQDVCSCVSDAASCSIRKPDHRNSRQIESPCSDIGIVHGRQRVLLGLVASQPCLCRRFSAVRNPRSRIACATFMHASETRLSGPTAAERSLRSSQGQLSVSYMKHPIFLQ